MPKSPASLDVEEKPPLRACDVAATTTVITTSSPEGAQKQRLGQTHAILKAAEPPPKLSTA
jgi:hypothetical protein